MKKSRRRRQPIPPLDKAGFHLDKAKRAGMDHRQAQLHLNKACVYLCQALDEIERLRDPPGR